MLDFSERKGGTIPMTIIMNKAQRVLPLYAFLRLQQSATFSPFMQKFVPFAEIAFRASQHDIPDSIASPARERNNVLNMINVLNLAFYISLLEFTVAIITFMLLSHQLILKFLSSVRASIALLASLAITYICIKSFTVSSVSISSYLTLSFSTSAPIVSLFCSVLLRVGFPTFSLQCIAMQLIETAVFKKPFTISHIPKMFLLFGNILTRLFVLSSAILATRFQSILTICGFPEVFRCGWFYLFACRTAFMSFWYRSINFLWVVLCPLLTFLSTKALLAQWEQAIFASFMRGKPFRSGKIIVRAYLTLLALWRVGEYTVHTLSLLCLASRPGVLPAPLGLNNYSSNYTTNQHYKPLYAIKRGLV